MVCGLLCQLGMTLRYLAWSLLLSAPLYGSAACGSVCDEFVDDASAAWDFPRSQMSIHLIGSSVGPHVGPGAYGAVVLQRPA